MKRSITYLGCTLGSAALITVGLGCSHESKQAQAPTGQSSPTFESNVPPPGTPTPPPAAGQEQPPLPPDHEAPQPPPPGGAQATPPSPGDVGAPPEGAPRPTEQPSTMGAGENEHQLCDTLASDAKLHVEDVQHGVAIVGVPRTGHDISGIRDDARRIEGTMRKRGAEATPGRDTCGLFSIARLPDVNVSVGEGAHSVRIVMTTTNPAEVKDLRRIARDQVGAMMKTRGR